MRQIPQRIALFFSFLKHTVVGVKTVSLIFWCEEGASSYFIFPSFFKAILAKWDSEKTGHLATNSRLARFLNMFFSSFFLFLSFIYFKCDLLILWFHQLWMEWTMMGWESQKNNIKRLNSYVTYDDQSIKQNQIK